MRNGMVSGVLTTLLSAAFAIDPSTMPPAMQGATQGVVAIAGAVLAHSAIVDRMPWDIEEIINELKLEMPPSWVMGLSRAIAGAWMLVLATNAAHIFTGDLVDETGRAFAAQMAFALSMAPSGDALAGTLMQKDRFANKTGKYRTIEKGADGKFRTSPVTEFFQLLLNQPGPVVITLGIAFMTNHHDLVNQFFYLG